LSRRRCGSRRLHRTRRARADHPRVCREHARRRACHAGGLARVANEAAADVVSTQRGGGAKDVWVLGETARASNADPDRHGSRQVGRAARQDYIPVAPGREPYWLGRYAVRCENTARCCCDAGRAQRSRVLPHARRSAAPRRGGAGRRSLRRAARARLAGLHGRRQTPGVVRVAGAQPPVGALLARRGGPAAPDAGGRGSRGSSREVLRAVLLSLAALTGFSKRT
jgi:hypothetical protein